MSDPQSINTLLLEDMISSRNERVFTRKISDLTIQVIFDGRCASTYVGRKHPIGWNNSRHVPLWRFNLHCGIEETGCPGIICIICHQVLCHPSEHGTSSMTKHFLAKAYIARLNESTELEVSELTSTTVDETALAIIKRQRKCGNTIVCSQKKFIFDS